MHKVKITAVRKAIYPDLMAIYENPIEHACDVMEGQSFISVDGQKPEGLCDSAWESMEKFVKELASNKGRESEFRMYELIEELTPPLI